MSQTSKRRVTFLCMALLSVVILLSSGLFSAPHSAPHLTPRLTIIPIYASPSSLAAQSVVAFSEGTDAWVLNQGVWTLATCPSVCDETNTCVTPPSGDGGTGCWMRTGSFPGAASVMNWFVDSALGSNAASCQAPGANACQDLQEIVRRIGTQGVLVSPTIFLSGSFADTSTELSAAVGTPFQFMSIVGERTFTGTDGGTLWTGTIAAYQAWDAGLHLEGIATVVPVDGGVALPAQYLGLATGYGYFLEDETGSNAGIGFPMYMPDAGVLDANFDDAANAVSFYTPGGQYPNSQVPSQFEVGDVVRLYTTTQVATTPGSQLNVRDGVWVFQDVWMGNGPHTVQIQAPCGPGCGAVQFNSCTINGLDVFTGGWMFAYGSQFVNGVRINGQTASLQSNQFDGIEIRANGFVELSGWNIIGPGGLQVGRQGAGAGTGEIDVGPLAIIGYENPAIAILGPGGAVFINNVNVWGRNSAGESGPVPTIHTYTGSPGVTYTPSFAPVAVGTQLGSPWVVGGTSFSSLPATNNGTGIQVWQ